MKSYIKPESVVTHIAPENTLLTGSTDEGFEIDNAFSKGHNSFFDSWDSNDEEEQPGFTSKNLWED